ncbi:MAG: hypothetical protein VKO21_08280 [Candidatus Sericytochromatia bacterium]|nr:hypothetical protein [Candidatus Sericytochromatia bacterium]
MAINGPSSPVSPFANTDMHGGMRVAVPVIQSAKALGAARDAFHLSRAGAEATRAMMHGGVEVAGGIFSGIGSAISTSLRSLPGLLKSNFALAGLMSVFTNALDLFSGRSSFTKFIANSAGDTVAYTGIGATATMVGGLVGSLVPGVGTVLGIGVGALFSYFAGKFYENRVRSGLNSAIQGQLEGLTNQASGPVAPTPTAPTPAQVSAASVPAPAVAANAVSAQQAAAQDAMIPVAS